MTAWARWDRLDRQRRPIRAGQARNAGAGNFHASSFLPVIVDDREPFRPPSPRPAVFPAATIAVDIETDQSI